MLARALMSIASIGLLCASVYADGGRGTEAVDASQIIAMVQAGGPGAPTAGPQDFPKFEDVTKDMTSKAGLFTLWSYPPDKKDGDKEKLLCQIPSGFLGEKFMLSTSFAGGGFFTGFPLEERVVQWEMLDKQLLLVEPNPRYLADKDKPVSDVVKRTYPEEIRIAVPILTKSVSGDPVIDLGPLLKSDFADIGWMAMGRPAMINPVLSKWTTKKTFELNVEIGVELAMAQMNPPGSFTKKTVHFSFWKLPKSDYSPRIADDRVGYFITANQDWSKPSDARDLFNRYIDRWHLQKRDASLALCEPKDPIIFYIEKTVPVRFRKAVRDGILEWNRAFEKVGYVDAVQVRQQTDDNEWKDLDPEDMRYSFFRWIVSGASFAMGPHRANPFTGQIYDADIIFDDSMVRVWEKSAQRLLASSVADMKAHDPTLEAFLKQNPQFRRPERSWEQFTIGRDDQAELTAAMRDRMRERGVQFCEYSEGMKHEMALAHAALAGAPPEVIEKFLYDVIKEVVSHEVGHTLGLRHNFKASTIYSLDEIKRRRGTNEPTAGSVMDYNPTLFFAKNAREGHFVTPTIGPYDYWAIEYGYRPADGSFKAPSNEGDKKKDEKPAELASAKPNPMDLPKELLDKLTPEARKALETAAASTAKPVAGDGIEKAAPPAAAPSGEQGMLEAIAARAAEPELAYASDEDTTMLSPDPRSNRFDQGASPIDWARERITLVNDRMKDILEWSVKDKESWYFARSSFLTLLFEKSFVLDYVGRYAGGVYTSRSHRGDADAPAPFEPVDPKLQREAMAFIEENLFSNAFFSFPPEVLNHLATPRWWHDGTTINFAVDFPVHEYISAMQWGQLFDRLFPNTLRRIYDGEMRSAGSDKFTLAEYLQRMQKGCWSDVTDKNRAKSGTWSDASPYLTSVRRSLQREYLNVLEPLVRTKPGALVPPDVHAMVQHSLRTLGQQIDDVMAAGNLDFASAAHLTSCKSRIERMLSPKLDEYGASMDMGM